jgi:hypothetical protein
MSTKDRLYTPEQIAAMSTGDLRAKERQALVLVKAASRSKSDLHKEIRRRHRLAVASRQEGEKAARAALVKQLLGDWDSR